MNDPARKPDLDPVPTPPLVTGVMRIDTGFRTLASQFFDLFHRTQDGGGALAVYLHGEPVLDVWAGWATPVDRWQMDTVALSFSTGKGVASTVLHRLAERGIIDYDAPVAQYWPEFAAAGKEGITIRGLMSHRAGLHRVRGLVRGPLGLMDHAAVTAALAASAPDPRSPRVPGYHAVTYGTLVAELATRATGTPFAELVRTEIAEPLGVPEFWFVVPPEERHRIAKSFPRITPFRLLPWETTSFALSRIPGLRGVADAGMPQGFDELVRNPAIHDVAMPGWNGVFNARALAKMYGALANSGSVEGIRFLRPETVAQMSEVQTTDRDYVLGIRMNWRLGYHSALVASRTQYGHAFGHYGLGGSGAFADTESGLALAFVTNRMGNALTPLTDLRMMRLGAQAQSIARRM